jgi:hypothetical protein
MYAYIHIFTDQQLAAGNITGSQAMHILQQVTEAVYAASGSAANEFDPYACNLGGLSKLAHCPFETQVYPGDAPKATIWRSDGNVLRGVTLAGLFVPAPWATGGQALTVKEAQAWYTPNDFADMRNMGINTVVIPIPTTNAFWLDNHHHNRHDNTSPSMQLLRSILGMVSNAKLQVILLLLAVWMTCTKPSNGPHRSCAITMSIRYRLCNCQPQPRQALVLLTLMFIPATACHNCTHLCKWPARYPSMYDSWYQSMPVNCRMSIIGTMIRTFMPACRRITRRPLPILPRHRRSMIA